VFEYGKDGPRVILVGIDGSPTSMRAGAYAAGLARRQGARLVIVYVTSTAPGLAGLSAGATLGIEQAHDQTEGEIRDIADDRSAELGVGYEFLRRHGDAYHEIVKAADEMHADAIVVGASSAFGHRMVGSLAVHLVRTGRWPVTVVP
jgi:nucleotide-binding universal stress UspA family protein